ncbi:UxaA family hydrolase [Paenibacillus filicis]|uniref:UxaA family hydrolase n=1 Tax=Paenibacillus gyeongsangnamensis TaxID=3388067 RepID=A0ABT4QDZ4_9BACL|nr:UxaA family hydrolase [Paenibacillus filicis]MCZ8515094.1 UxaA family hydrolase [Paenibacillus filicis]
MEKRYKTVMMNAQDQVAVALENIPEGAVVQVDCQGNSFKIDVREPIDFGHKFAVTAIGQGEDVLKYGEVIGAASRDIFPGEHVHIHNLEGKRGRGDQIAGA